MRPISEWYNDAQEIPSSGPQVVWHYWYALDVCSFPDNLGFCLWKQVFRGLLHA